MLKKLIDSACNKKIRQPRTILSWDEIIGQDSFKELFHAEMMNRKVKKGWMDVHFQKLFTILQILKVSCELWHYDCKEYFVPDSMHVQCTDMPGGFKTTCNLS